MRMKMKIATRSKGKLMFRGVEGAKVEI